MPRLAQEIVVARPPEAVFAVLTDFPRAPVVLPGVLESRVLTPGPLGVGSRVLERREVKGRVRETEFLVTALDPPRRLRMDVLSGGRKAGEGGFDLVPEGGGTRLGYSLSFSLPGVTKLLAPFVRPIVEREMAGDLAALKRAAEGA